MGIRSQSCTLGRGIYNEERKMGEKTRTEREREEKDSQFSYRFPAPSSGVSKFKRQRKKESFLPLTCKAVYGTHSSVCQQQS